MYDNTFEINDNLLYTFIAKYNKTFSINPSINLRNIGISHDEMLYFTIYKYNAIAKKFTINRINFDIDKKRLKLRNLCATSSTTINDVITYMKKHNIKIDRYCVDFAYSCDNQQLVKYFIKNLKCYPSILILYRHVNFTWSRNPVNTNLHEHVKYFSSRVTKEHMEHIFSHIKI